MTVGPRSGRSVLIVLLAALVIAAVGVATARASAGPRPAPDRCSKLEPQDREACRSSSRSHPSAPDRCRKLEPADAQACRNAGKHRTPPKPPKPPKRPKRPKPADPCRALAPADMQSPRKPAPPAPTCPQPPAAPSAPAAPAPQPPAKAPPVPAPAPPRPPVFPTAHDDAIPLAMHAGPHVGDRIVGRVPAGASVAVLCQAPGDRASDPKYGTTTWWDLVRYGSATGYVTDLYVLSGRDRVAPLCP